MEETNKKELLNDIKDYVKRIDSSLENFIEEIRKTNNITNLADLIEGLVYTFRGIELLNIENIDISVEDLNENINEILDGMENQDFNLIADILEYEIMEKINDLNNDLKNI